MPDRIEVASSGRARCRACRRAVAKGEERFAEAVPNPVAEGESQHYYHLACAAERRPKPFATLLAALDPPRPDLAPLAASAQLALHHHRLERLGTLERAKSARANCRQCRDLIEKDAWRIALQPIEEGRLASWGFIHLACAASYAGIKPSLERLTRYTDLDPAAHQQIAATLAAMPEPAPQAPSTTDDPDPTDGPSTTAPPPSSAPTEEPAPPPDGNNA